MFTGVPGTSQGNGSLFGTMTYTEGQLRLGMTPQRTSPSVVTTTNLAPFAQSIQDTIVVSVPTQSDVVATNAPT